MLLAHLDYPATYNSFIANSQILVAIKWLKSIPPDYPIGDFTIDGRKLYASIQEFKTLNIASGQFEAHRNYIDLHYCISGSENIAWAPVSVLKTKIKYNTELDYTLYQTPSEFKTIRLTPGFFAIFLPGDAHMPKISDGKSNLTKKAVLKIKHD